MDEYKKYLKEIRRSLDFWQEVFINEFTEDVARLMDECSVSRAELARRVGKRPSFVSRVLNGNANFTLKTMTKLALALDSVVHVHIAHKDAVTRWVDKFEDDTETVAEARLDLKAEFRGIVGGAPTSSDRDNNVTYGRVA